MDHVRRGRLLARSAASVLWISLSALGLVHCKGETASAPPPPLVQVEVAEVIQKDVPIQMEWVGTTDGSNNALIRAQVNGYLLRRPYTEGSFVKKGDLLFQLDPSKFQTALDQAQGELAKAQAQFTKSKQDVDRDTPLAKEGAISQKELDDSVQSHAATRGSLAAAKAAVEQAKLNLGWTRITAPIDGVVGISKAQIGDLIDASTELTSVSTLDPIKVYFTPTEREYLNFNRANPTQSELEAARNKLELELVLVDGSVYPQKGRFYVRDRQVDQKTGAIKVAGLFPNPGALLRPGQYGRVRAVINVRKDALLVPQRAVSELQGSYRVAVVGGDNKVNIRAVTVGERVGSLWIVESGLSPGERVVAEGTQRVRPDAVVDPKPYVEAPPTPAPAR